MKRPFIRKDYRREFHILWIGRICINWTCKAKRERHFIEIWNGKRSVMLVIGKLGLGFGHSFGLK